jgi:uncharacterized membrane protein
MRLLPRVFLCFIMIAITLISASALSPSTQAASSTSVTTIRLASDYGLNDSAASGTGLSKKPLKESILSIIRWSLGSLGLVAVVLVLYGGFMWMTASGNDDRISKAKQIISAALIGMIIILLSFAIVQFFGKGVNNVVNT